MKTFCEIVVSDFLPAVRALVTKELINTYGMTQTEVAKRMGMTQPAISYYLRELRGTKVKVLEKNSKLMEFVKQVAVEISSGKEQIVNMHEICKRLRDEKLLSEHERLQCCSLCKC
jgi:predicted transcriptional regulator